MDESKFTLLKSLPLWNIVITVILGIIGFFVAIGIQNRVEKLEIENRTKYSDQK